MADIETVTSKRLLLVAGRSHPQLAEAVSRELGVAIAKLSAYDFANGEIFVRFEESVRGADAFVLQSHTAPINKWIMEQLLIVDALRRASARRITVIMPYYGYARQDKKHRGREPISARLMADLLKTAGADRIMTIDLHTAQILGFFDGPVDHLVAIKTLAEYINSKKLSINLNSASYLFEFRLIFVVISLEVFPFFLKKSIIKPPPSKASSDL